MEYEIDAEQENAWYPFSVNQSIWLGEPVPFGQIDQPEVRRLRDDLLDYPAMGMVWAGFVRAANGADALKKIDEYM